MTNARFSILQARAVEDPRISNSQFRTLAALGTFGDKDGWCFPKLTTLGKILNKSRQAVSKDLQELNNLGYIEITPQYREDGSRKHNLYRLIFDTPQSDVDTPQPNTVDTPSTSEVDTPQPNTVDALTPHINDPLNDPKEEGAAAFDEMQSAIERLTGIMPAGPAGIKAIDDLIEMKATKEDIERAYAWIKDNGKKFRYYSQLVGPARTAISIRRQEQIKPACVPTGGQYGGKRG